jgi:hypothetical protein
MRLALVAIAVGACGAPPPPVVHAEVAHAILPDVPFDDLDHEQRAEFMKQRVLPAMTPVFAGHLKTALTCETCHGKSVDGGYRMPNPALPKLGDDLSHYKRADVEWMARDVKPTMAKVLGRIEASSTKAEGFGCSACHTLEP